MKSQLIAIVAAVVLVGCGPSVSERALIKAAHSGNIEVAKQAIADGADVNAKNYRGGTSMHYAAYYGHKNIVELLIAKSANVNAKDDKGRTPLRGGTPLDQANWRNQTEIADLLRKHGGKTGEELKAEGAK